MAFTDIIDDYSDGATGTLTDAQGDSVNYTVTQVGGVDTITRPNTDEGAQISADGSDSITVDFDSPVQGLTISIDRSNPGETYFITIDGVQVDLNDAIANGDVIFTTVIAGTDPPQAGTHEVTGDGGVTSSGGFGNDSLGFIQFTTAVSSVSISGGSPSSGGWDLFEIGIDSEAFNVVCFAAGTDILTPDGPCLVEALVAGQRVVDFEGRSHRIIDVFERQVTALERLRETRLAPVHIAAGALGHGLPATELRVSRQHRVMIASRIARRVTGRAEVLISAMHLVGLPGVTADLAIAPISYHHILLADHAVLCANGAPAESLYLGPVSRQVLGDELPEVPADAAPTDQTDQITPALPLVAANDARKIVAAHRRHGRALLECLNETAEVALP